MCFTLIRHSNYIYFNPLPGGYEIYNFGRPFLGNHCYIFSLSDLCSRNRDFKGNNAFSLYDSMKPCSSTRTPAPGVMKFTILVDPSMVIMTIHVFSLFDLCLGVEKNILKEIFKFYTFYQILSFLGMRGYGIFHLLTM